MVTFGTAVVAVIWVLLWLLAAHTGKAESVARETARRALSFFFM
jgi:hypothetical protein